MHCMDDKGKISVQTQDRDWTPRLDAAQGPIYLAIADAIGTDIAKGELRAGERLPTHRALAERLGVDLTTVTRAYAEARRRGLVEASVGRGTFVRAPAPMATEPSGGVDLGMNLPPQPTDPSLRELLQQGFARLLAGADARMLTYRSGAGSPEERAAGATWLRPTLGAVDPERVLLAPGAQPALLAALGAVAAAGEVVLTDRLTYPGLRCAAAQLGLRLVAVAGDAEGMLPAALDAACRDSAAKALYCTPTIHNPTAVTMPPARRHEIAGLARRHGLSILEDDAYGLLPSAPLPAIASLAPEISVHIATVSKVLSPALRVAYVVAPDARWATRLSVALRAAVLMTSPLLAGLVTAWIADGTAGAVVAAIRRESAARQRIAREILPADAIDAHPEGLHLWLRLPARWDRLAFVAHLRRQGGLAVVPSDAFAIGDAPPPGAVRVSLGAAPDRESLRQALRAVAAALAEYTPVPFFEVV